MKQKLLHITWSIYQDIIYTGVNEGSSREHEKKIIRFNQFIILALLVNCFSVGIYIYHKLYISGLSMSVPLICFYWLTILIIGENSKLVAYYLLLISTFT